MAGIYIEINQGQIDHIQKMLSSTPEQTLRIISNALNRGMMAGRTQAEKEIRQRYDIKTENLRADHTYKTIKVRKPVLTTDGIRAELSFSGSKIPLYRFHPSPAVRQYTNGYVPLEIDDRWRSYRKTGTVYAADIKGYMIRRDRGFIATFKSGHTGIFRRNGETTKTGKSKIVEYWGPSVKDMLDYPPARENVQERMQEITAKRLDHELLRVLKGL